MPSNIFSKLSSRFIKSLAYLLLVSFPLLSQDIKPNKLEPKVNNFLKKYLKQYNYINEFLNYKSNDAVLDRQVDTLWTRSVTLKSKHLMKMKNSYDIYQRFFLGFYKFNSDSSCSAALDSLKNCLGSECSKITAEDNGKPLKTPPFIYIKNNDEIIVCKINCAHDNAYWANFKKDLLKTFSKINSEIIESGCGGPVYIKTPAQ